MHVYQFLVRVASPVLEIKLAFNFANLIMMLQWMVYLNKVYLSCGDVLSLLTQYKKKLPMND